MKDFLLTFKSFITYVFLFGFKEVPQCLLTKRYLVVGMISFAKGGRENVSVERDMVYVLPKSHSSVGAVEICAPDVILSQRQPHASLRER